MNDNQNRNPDDLADALNTIQRSVGSGMTPLASCATILQHQAYGLAASTGMSLSQAISALLMAAIHTAINAASIHRLNCDDCQDTSDMDAMKAGVKMAGHNFSKIAASIQHVMKEQGYRLPDNDFDMTDDDLVSALMVAIKHGAIKEGGKEGSEASLRSATPAGSA